MSNNKPKARVFDVETELADIFQNHLPAPQKCNHDDNSSSVIALTKPSREETSSEDEIGPPIPEYLINKNMENEEKVNGEKHTKMDLVQLENSVELMHGPKAVSAIAVDLQGNRMVTGSQDSIIKFWEFKGMTKNSRAFRTITPEERQVILSLSYNNSGSHVLTCSASTQAKLYSREGSLISETPKGYCYLSDLSNTKGHIGDITQGTFHRFENAIFATASLDGTLRVWDSEKGLSKHTTIYKLKNRQGRKISAHSCSFSSDCKLISGGLGDGSILLWDVKKSPFVSPELKFENAHSDNSQISSIDFSSDGKFMLSRANDDKCVLYDLRMTKKVLHEINGLDTKYEMTNAQFNQTGSHFITTTSKQNSGSLNFYSTSSCELVQKIPFIQNAPTCCLWSSKLNQIFCCCSDGTIKGFFASDDASGLSKVNPISKPEGEDYEYIKAHGFAPFSNPLFADDRKKSKRTQELKIRKDKQSTREPDLPLSKGEGGRVVEPKSEMAQYYKKQGEKLKHRSDDIRANLLRHEEEVGHKNEFTKIYQKNQPKPLFSKHEEEDKDDENGPDAKKHQS